MTILKDYIKYRQRSKKEKSWKKGDLEYEILAMKRKISDGKHKYTSLPSYDGDFFSHVIKAQIDNGRYYMAYVALKDYVSHVNEKEADCFIDYIFNYIENGEEKKMDVKFSERDISFMSCVWLSRSSYIARDYDGKLYLHLYNLNETPERSALKMKDGCWELKGGTKLSLNKQLFKFVTWDKPWPAEDLQRMLDKQLNENSRGRKVVYDIETTGLDPADDEIVQISAMDENGSE